MAKEKTLNERLIEIQHTLKAPKGQTNNFGGYKYRSAEDILEAVKPLLFEHGVSLILTDEPIAVGDWHYIKATAVLHCGEEECRVSAVAREALSKKGMDDSQITGTASSYARKYALNGLFAIDDTKDADTNEYRKQSVDLAHQILNVVRQAGLDVKQLGTIIHNIYGKNNSSECTQTELKDLLDHYKEYYDMLNNKAVFNESEAEASQNIG